MAILRWSLDIAFFLNIGFECLICMEGVQSDRELTHWTEAKLEGNKWTGTEKGGISMQVYPEKESWESLETTGREEKGNLWK